MTRNSKPLVITAATKEEVERLSRAERGFCFYMNATKVSPWLYTEENPLWFTTSFNPKRRSN